MLTSTLPLPAADWRELLRWVTFRRKRFLVENCSMQPTLSPNDLVFVDVAAYRTNLPKEDDIVVARHPHTSELAIIKRVQFLDEAGRCYLISDNAAVQRVETAEHLASCRQKISWVEQPATSVGKNK